jgi:transposase
VNKVPKSNSDGKVSSMFVGMDLHKKYLQVAIVDDKGKVVENSKMKNDLVEVDKFFKDVNNDAKVVMESSCVWYNIYEYLSKEKHLDVVLSNPIKTKAIASAKIKTDKLDALKLANLLRGGYIAECYVPDRKIMDLRELVRHRLALVRIRTRMKNKIHGITLMRGVRITDDVHPFSHMYIEKLKGMNDYRINGYLRIIESLDSEINDVSRKIRLYVKENDIARLLMTIPGIGHYSSLLIVSEIGDINRFPDSCHLCSYAGLVPSIHSSGGVTHYGSSITKTGSKHLRWIMLECVHAHIRNDKNTQATLETGMVPD